MTFHQFIDKYLPLFIIGAGAALIAPIFYFANIAVKSDRVRREECFIAGGIFLSDFCVKPGSFIELKSGK